ncbi:MAG: carboxymuconolactone decarboxylase family protein, partial [Gammaproteobacteria bacterium]
MLAFPVHTPDTASEPGKKALEVSATMYGSIPNLHGVMANSPALLEAYQALNKIFMQSSLSNDERNVIWLAVNYENNCHYCMAAHSMIAKMTGMNDADIEALRTGNELSDPKLQTLRAFTVHMLDARGWAAPEQLAAMETAGYSAQTVLDVVLGIGMKTLSNYTNHLADTPVDDGFKEFAWNKT